MEFRTKVCTQCNRELDITLFRKKPNSEERKNICKFCYNKLKISGFKYCRQCEQIFPATSEHFPSRIVKGQEKLDTICRKCDVINVAKWQKENKDKANAKALRYQKTEKGKKSTVRKHNNYKNKVKNLPNTLTDEQWFFTKYFFNNRCAYALYNLKILIFYFLFLMSKKLVVCTILQNFYYLLMYCNFYNMEQYYLCLNLHCY